MSVPREDVIPGAFWSQFFSRRGYTEIAPKPDNWLTRNSYRNLRRLLLSFLLAAIVAGILFLPVIGQALGIATFLTAASHGAFAATHVPWLMEILCIATGALFPFVSDALGRFSSLLTWPMRAAVRTAKEQETAARPIAAACLRGLGNIAAALVLPAAVLRIVATGLHILVSGLTLNGTGEKAEPALFASTFKEGYDQVNERAELNNLFTVRFLKALFSAHFDLGERAKSLWRVERILLIFLKNLHTNIVRPVVLLLEYFVGLGIFASHAHNLALRLGGGKESSERTFFQSLGFGIFDGLSRILSIPVALMELTVGAFVHTLYNPSKPCCVQALVKTVNAIRTESPSRDGYKFFTLSEDAPPVPINELWVSGGAPYIRRGNKLNLLSVMTSSGFKDISPFPGGQNPQMFWALNEKNPEKANLYCRYNIDGEVHITGPLHEHVVDVAHFEICATVGNNGHVSNPISGGQPFSVLPANLKEFPRPGSYERLPAVPAPSVVPASADTSKAPASPVRYIRHVTGRKRAPHMVDNIISNNPDRLRLPIMTNDNRLLSFDRTNPGSSSFVWVLAPDRKRALLHIEYMENGQKYTSPALDHYVETDGTRVQIEKIGNEVNPPYLRECYTWPTINQPTYTIKEPGEPAQPLSTPAESDSAAGTAATAPAQPAAALLDTVARQTGSPLHTAAAEEAAASASPPKGVSPELDPDNPPALTS